MPIEIKELHIRIAVNAPENITAPSAPGGATPSATGGADRETLVAECVEQVLQVLQQKQER